MNVLAKVCHAMRKQLVERILFPDIISSIKKEQETLYVRHRKGGEMTSTFLCIDQPASTSANDVLEFVIKKFKELDILEDVELGKLVGFVADGAANMLGCRSG